MGLRLVPVTPADLPQLTRWLRAEHVRRFWGDVEENLKLLAAAQANGHWRAIIEYDGRKVGLVLWQHPTREELDAATLLDLPDTVIDIDIMLGDVTAIRQGVGSATIAILAQTILSDPAIPFLMACARWDNLASQKAFTKAGFYKDREFNDPPHGERYALMIRQR